MEGMAEYTLTEIAEDVFRISIFVPEIHLGFSHFLVRDDEPLLFHTGLRRMFPMVREAVAKVLNPSSLRHIGFSHFESDECGSLNQWLELAPQAQPVCGLVGAMVTINDFSNRPARSLRREDSLSTGKHRFRLIPTPHLPHGWDAGLLFEETKKILFCSDLFLQGGDCDPVTSHDIMGRCRADLIAAEGGPLAGAVPYTANTGKILRDLAGCHPEMLAIMHGSSYSGDGSAALTDLAAIFKEVLGPRDDRQA